MLLMFQIVFLKRVKEQKYLQTNLFIRNLESRLLIEIHNTHHMWLMIRQKVTELKKGNQGNQGNQATKGIHDFFYHNKKKYKKNQATRATKATRATRATKATMLTKQIVPLLI